MSRTLATLVLAITASSTFAQAADPSDPIERITDRIMRTFMPSTFLTPFSPTPKTLRAEPVDRRQPSANSGSPLDRQLDTQLDTQIRSDLDGTIERLQEPVWVPVRQALPELDPMPAPRSFRSFPMMDFPTQTFASGSFSSSNRRSARSNAGAKVTPLPRIPAPPAPLSFSRASANGIHAIDAIVPTERGAKRVELHGTSSEVRRQVDALPMNIRPMMERALGL